MEFRAPMHTPYQRREKKDLEFILKKEAKLKKARKLEKNLLLWKAKFLSSPFQLNSSKSF